MVGVVRSAADGSTALEAFGPRTRSHPLFSLSCLGFRLAAQAGLRSCGYVILFLGAFTLVNRLLNPPLPATTPISQATFDIRDGARVSRVHLDDILAIASAGNYVEFKLRGAKTLLMRSALSAIEQELAPSGFLRTHRSWLVNAKHVSGLVPEGSGDYKIELEGFTVPLSRRFPEALAKLRGT